MQKAAGHIAHGRMRIAHGRLRGYTPPSRRPRLRVPDGLGVGAAVERKNAPGRKHFGKAPRVGGLTRRVGGKEASGAGIEGTRRLHRSPAAHATALGALRATGAMKHKVQVKIPAYQAAGINSDEASVYRHSTSAVWREGSQRRIASLAPTAVSWPFM